jgi:hypothetical protein
MQGYVTTTYLVEHPESVIGLRTPREMRLLSMVSALVHSGWALWAQGVNA